MRTHRVIIGFSVRQHPDTLDSGHQVQKCALLDTHPLRFAQPLSLGWDEWDVIKSEQFERDVNRTNLLPLPDTFGVGAADPRKACLIAIDMERQYAIEVEDKYGLITFTNNFLKLSPYWSFLGYDVISLGGLTSALYGYDWSSDGEKISCPKIQSNAFGLVSDLPSAELLENFINKEPPEDVPFYAAGVWIKHRSEDGLLVKL